jgi:hypothetical protein
MSNIELAFPTSLQAGDTASVPQLLTSTQTRPGQWQQGTKSEETSQDVFHGNLMANSFSETASRL